MTQIYGNHGRIEKKRDGFGAEKTRLAPLPPRHAELDSASQRRDPEINSG
jgi:hypothetical protein